MSESLINYVLLGVLFFVVWTMQLNFKCIMMMNYMLMPCGDIDIEKLIDWAFYTDVCYFIQ